MFKLRGVEVTTKEYVKYSIWASILDGVSARAISIGMTEKDIELIITEYSNQQHRIWKLLGISKITDKIK